MNDNDYHSIILYPYSDHNNVVLDLIKSINQSRENFSRKNLKNSKRNLLEIFTTSTDDNNEWMIRKMMAKNFLWIFFIVVNRWFSSNIFTCCCCCCCSILMLKMFFGEKKFTKLPYGIINFEKNKTQKFKISKLWKFLNWNRIFVNDWLTKRNKISTKKNILPISKLPDFSFSNKTFLQKKLLGWNLRSTHTEREIERLRLWFKTTTEKQTLITYQQKKNWKKLNKDVLEENFLFFGYDPCIMVIIIMITMMMNSVK